MITNKKTNKELTLTVATQFKKLEKINLANKSGFNKARIQTWAFLFYQLYFLEKIVPDTPYRGKLNILYLHFVHS